MKDSRPPLLVILGPTAVGKTAFSIRLAARLGGEIVSADSRLFYRGMDIGSAKPSLEERAGIPHHLIDVADPDETWSLSRFQQEAQRALADIHARGALPILVGGTGQYIRAVIENWDPPPAAREGLREILQTLSEAHPPEWLHERLRILDPGAAASIDPRNRRRVVRAVEVILTTGKRFSEQRRRGESPYRLLLIGLKRPRPELYERIDKRIERMFAEGFLDEVQRLLDAGYAPTLPAMSAIGYRQAAAVLRGEMSLDEAKRQMKRQTRIFVRRQGNWFKENDPSIHWLEAGKAEIVEEAVRLAQMELGIQ